MCDTVAFPPDGARAPIFGKNSDREPGEPQLIQHATVDTVTADSVRRTNEKPAYIANNLPTLEKALESLARGGRAARGALLSRPFWMWGAEMGVNDAGVAIGNEAVFSRRRAPGAPLLGMDILRLALHFSSTAAEAVDLIRELVEQWGQGGDGGWKHRTEYSNSYLVQDAAQAWLVETSGQRVRVRQTHAPTGISNTYDRDGDWDEWPRLKARDERPLIALGARGRRRNVLKLPWLTGQAAMSGPEHMFALLRAHGSADGRPRRGMGSLCIHTGLLIKSETTASMVVQWREDGPVAWATGNSWPCVSLYKPFSVGPANPAITGVNDEEAARALRERRERVAHWASRNTKEFERAGAPARDTMESEFLDRVADAGQEDLPTIVAECHRKESVYLQQVEARMA